MIRRSSRYLSSQMTTAEVAHMFGRRFRGVSKDCSPFAGKIATIKMLRSILIAAIFVHTAKPAPNHMRATSANAIWPLLAQRAAAFIAPIAQSRASSRQMRRASTSLTRRSKVSFTCRRTRMQSSCRASSPTYRVYRRQWRRKN